MNYIDQYLEEIRKGRCIVSSRVLRQYEALAADIRSLSSPYIFDEKKAERPIRFIEQFCRHSKAEWAGKPVILELFQKAYISALFGFVEKSTGFRRFRETLFYVARKNGKSTMLSGIALYMLIADGEAGAEVYSVATKRDQARIIFDETVNMVRQSQDLLQVVKKRKSDLYFALTFSKMQPLGKNSDTLDGLNSHLVIMDELHGIKDRNLYEVMKQSQSARRQPLLIMITTAGTIRECIFDDMYKYACGVCDGTIMDDHFLPVLYELDSKKEWTDPMAWEKANPGLNRDLLLAGCLFHDCGKLWENCYPKEDFTMPYSEAGELLGHIPLGIELVNNLWKRIMSLPEADSWKTLDPPSPDVRMHLLHLIASHHGELAFGSPVFPKTPEAVALHYIDNLDAKLEMFRGAYETSEALAPRVLQRKAPLPANVVLPLPSVLPLEPDGADAMP